MDEVTNIQAATQPKRVSLSAVRDEAAKITSMGSDFLIVKPGNQWMKEAKDRPPSRMLFGEFFYEDELSILFADTNMGKSILAVQIADAISRGSSVLGLDVQTAPQPVLYFDFELSDKQFQTRYTDLWGNLYEFDDNFSRAEINPDAEPPEGMDFEECVTKAIEEAIVKHKVRVLVVDNITYLRSGTEKARDALPLMKELKHLKRKYRLSILILAHTPKRSLTLPITRNDLQGSKMLINFCDSAFAIGESHKDSAVRYIKQIKARNTEVKYNADNVIVCEIRKESNFLEFDFREFGNEWEHLKDASDEEKETLESQILEVYEESSRNMSYDEIAKICNTYKMKVKRVIDKRIKQLEKEKGNL